MSIERKIERAALVDYPLSLQLAAEALWGGDFWGSRPPAPSAPKPSVEPRRRRRKPA